MPIIHTSRIYGRHSHRPEIHEVKNLLHNRASHLKSHILGVPVYLRNSWLEQVQKQALAPQKAPASIFEREKLLIESLFGGSDDAALTTIYQFYKTLKSDAKGVVSTQNTAGLGEVDAFREQIGQIVFLAERDAASTAALLNLKDVSNSLKRIQNVYVAEIAKFKGDIDSRRLLHDKTGLQDSTYVVSIQTSKAIASLLMTSSGYLNLGLINSIKSSFFDSSKPLLQYQKDLIGTLDVLNGSPDLQEQLRNVSKPSDPSLISNDLIRISLGLPNDTVVTDQNARYVALTGLIGDMRQGDVGSCFATNVSIMMMGALKGRVISDFTEILSEGKLTRKSATDQNDFVPYLDIGDGAIHNPFQVNSAGKVSGVQGYVWESPGIVAACRQLGIHSGAVETEIKNIISNEFKSQGLSSGGKIEASVSWLVGKLVDAKYGTGLTPLKKDDISSLALVAFSGETNTPMLRAWESCLAAMAEANSDNMVRSRIIESVVAPLTGLLPKTTITGNPTALARKVQDVFKKTVNSAIQIRYDEEVSIDTPQSSGDGHSTSLGAFVLHELNQGDRATSAKKVSNPEEFRTFVLNRVKTTVETLGTIASTASEQAEYKTTLEKIRDYVTKSATGAASYLYNALKGYDEDSNASLAYDLRNWEKFEHLPFRDATGNDNRVVFAKATGLDTNNSTSVRPRNAHELLERFIAFGKKRAKEDNFLTDDNPYQRYMADTPQHAFTLTPEDMSVVGAMKDGVTASEWIRVNIIRPGTSVSNLTLTPDQKSSYAELVENQIVPKELKSAYKSGVRRISTKSNTVNAYSNDLISVIQTITGRKDPAMKNYIAKSLTSILISTILPPAAQRTLSNTAARIADTNWVDQGVKHIYFACFFDPVTNSILLGTMNEDGQGLRPQDQDEWVTYVPWEMYGVKLEPTLAKAKVKALTVPA